MTTQTGSPREIAFKILIDTDGYMIGAESADGEPVDLAKHPFKIGPPAGTPSPKDKPSPKANASYECCCPVYDGGRYRCRYCVPS